LRNKINNFLSVLNLFVAENSRCIADSVCSAGSVYLQEVTAFDFGCPMRPQRSARRMTVMVSFVKSTSSVELVDTVAAALSWERTQVFHHARNLREAGVVTKGGRGFTAPQMNLLDGANLICAVLATERVMRSTIGSNHMKGSWKALRMNRQWKWVRVHFEKPASRLHGAIDRQRGRA